LVNIRLRSCGTINGEMTRLILIPSAILAVFLLAYVSAHAQQNAPARSTADSAKQPAKAPSAVAAPRRTAPARRKAAPRRVAGRAPAGSQMLPSRERLGEIQKALIEAGFNPGTADGVWGPNSIAALQDFQASRGLESTGRVNALTLIQLGLGPKYDTPSEPTITGASAAR
jgi:peptidoglycan hydrolase-like protein with peptidoglycan-binding domain